MIFVQIADCALRELEDEAGLCRYEREERERAEARWEALRERLAAHLSERDRHHDGGDANAEAECCEGGAKAIADECPQRNLHVDPSEHPQPIPRHGNYDRPVNR